MATAAINLEPLERLVTFARDAGLPRDGMVNFLSGGYVPLPKQILFHAAARECDRRADDSPTKAALGGARGGGKSNATLAQMALDDCQRQPELKCLFIRQIGKAARESFEDLRPKVLSRVKHKYVSSPTPTVEFSNGSRIIAGHFKNEKDIDNYLGLEYDVIGIEEATQLSAKKERQLATCNRTSKETWRPRMYYTFNPGGIGHAHIKQTFIEPYRRGAQADTRFVFATFRDNPFLNPEYVRNLNALIGWERRAWRDGDWDIAAGQFFTTWRHDIHVRRLKQLPAHWPVWGALDYGFTHPTVVYLLTEFDGKTFVWDEYHAARRLVSQNAEGIKAMLERHGVYPTRLREFVAGPDVFAQRGDQQGKTIADQYAETGIYLTPANADRINGAARVLKLLGDVDAGIAPRLVISDRCARLIECLPLMQHDPRRPEDVLKVDVDEDGNGGDDPYDGVRYGLMSNQSEGALI